MSFITTIAVGFIVGYVIDTLFETVRKNMYLNKYRSANPVVRQKAWIDIPFQALTVISCLIVFPFVTACVIVGRLLVTALNMFFMACIRRRAAAV